MTELLYTDSVVSGAAGYAPTSKLVEAWQQGRAARVWKLGVRIVSLQLNKANGRGLWKSAERLPLESPGPMLDALESVGVNHPSSFADCYHQLAPRSAPLPYTLNGIFTWWPGGPWEEARQTGNHRGNWYRYDLVSAYRWAATLGLPDPESYHVVERPIPPTMPGLWMYEPTIKAQSRRDLPIVYRRASRIVLTTEEIDAYGISGKVIRGVTWTRTLPGNFVERTLQKLPCAKEAGRAYWGRWIGRDRLSCWTANKEWALPNLTSHFVWGWLIVGRVRFRVWENAERASHVYVDEVVVPHTMATGTQAGDWHLKEHYPQGVNVYRTGWYGGRGKAPAMQTGVSRN